jgi:hypothetical protein
MTEQDIPHYFIPILFQSGQEMAGFIFIEFFSSLPIL